MNRIIKVQLGYLTDTYEIKPSGDYVYLGSRYVSKMEIPKRFNEVYMAPCMYIYMEGNIHEPLTIMMSEEEFVAWTTCQ